MRTLKSNLKTSCLILMICGSFSVFADSSNNPPRVVDNGPDGDERFYSVYCSDGTQAAVMKNVRTNSVCTAPQGQQEDVCKEWSVDEAARAACGV